MGAFAEGRSLYMRVRHDAGKVAALLEERNTLSDQLFGAESLQITSANVNGEQYSGTPGMSKSRRLQALDVFAQLADLGGAVSSRTTPVFQGPISPES